MIVTSTVPATGVGAVDSATPGTNFDKRISARHDERVSKSGSGLSGIAGVCAFTFIKYDQAISQRPLRHFWRMLDLF